jgi:hypothetical protein
MKVISLWQPWATLVAIGAKQYETRNWRTDFRGPIAIHATQSVSSECWRICKAEPINTLLRRGGYAPGRCSWRGCLPMGCIVAVADLVDCVGTDGYPASSIERALGDWNSGRFGWHLENVRCLEGSRPVYCKGAQGLWNLPADVEAEVSRRLESSRPRYSKAGLYGCLSVDCAGCTDRECTPGAPRVTLEDALDLGWLPRSKREEDRA